MCNIKYQAEDGELFDTEEECKKYEEKPHVWLVVELSPESSLKDVMVFSTQAQASIWTSNVINNLRATDAYPIPDYKLVRRSIIN